MMVAKDDAVFISTRYSLIGNTHQCLISIHVLADENDANRIHPDYVRGGEVYLAGQPLTPYWGDKVINEVTHKRLVAASVFNTDKIKLQAAVEEIVDRCREHIQKAYSLTILPVRRTCRINNNN